MLELDRKVIERLQKSSLEEVKALEKDCIISKFDYSVAFNLGCKVRQWAIELFPTKPIVIDISLPSGQCLFHSTSNSGTALDNDIWVSRKRKTALRFGCSSYFMGHKLRAKKLTKMEDAFYINSEEYAVHGGAVPIFLEGLDSIVAVLTVSGLAQEEDHVFALTCIKEFAQRLVQRDLDLD